MGLKNQSRTAAAEKTMAEPERLKTFQRVFRICSIGATDLHKLLSFLAFRLTSANFKEGMRLRRPDRGMIRPEFVCILIGILVIQSGQKRMNVALRALAVGSVVVLAAAAAQAADLSTPAVQVAQAQPAATATDQQPAPAKKQEKAADPKAAEQKAAPAKADPAKTEPAKTDAKAAPAKTDAKADVKPADPKAAAGAAAATAAPAATDKLEEKPLPANIAGECAYTGKRIVSLLARDDVDQARKFMDFYRVFSCDEKHIGPTFRCLVNDSTVNASAEDIAARIDRCWTKLD